MNKVYRVLSLLFLGLFIFQLSSCVIAPWSTVIYSTLPKNFYFNREAWGMLLKNEKDNLVKGVYFYSYTRGTNETNSSIDDPYYFQFNFITYTDDKKISIEKIEFHDEIFQKKLHLKFPILLETERRELLNSPQGNMYKSQAFFCFYSVDCPFYLKDYESEKIIITVSFSVTDEEGTETKTADYILKREINSGIIQLLE